MSQLGGQPSGRSVNDDMRRAAANLALVIRECGLSQSELSRRSGLSRQLINTWARQRISVSLSATVAQLLNCVQLKLADLLLDEQALYAKIGRAPQPESESLQVFPRLVRHSTDETCRRRLELMLGTFRYKTRLKEQPMFVLERTVQFLRDDRYSLVARVFEGVRISNKTYAEGYCLYY